MTRDLAKIMVEKYGIRSTTCDGCGKFEHGEPEGWVHIDYWHNDWDGAPETTDDHLDACSALCLGHVLSKITADYGEDRVPRPPTLRVHLSGFDFEVARDLAMLMACEAPDG